MIDKVRVHEIAKELGIKSKEVVDKATEMGLEVKTASSGVSPEEAEKIMNYIMNPAAAAPKPKARWPNSTLFKYSSRISSLLNNPSMCQAMNISLIFRM